MTNSSVLSLLLLSLAALFILNSAANDVTMGEEKSTFEEASTILLMSVNLAIDKTNETREFYITKLQQQESSSKSSPLKSALKECVYECTHAIQELKMIPQELIDDPMMTSYDALMAWDALKSCGDSLKCHRIDDYSILKIHYIATAYVDLCVHIAKNYF